MLQWNELRITPDGRYLIIDVEVQHLEYYDNVYLESISICVPKNPDDLKEYPMGYTEIWRNYDEPEKILPPNTEGPNIKHIRKFIDLDGTDWKDRVFFVYAQADVLESDEKLAKAPCGAKSKWLMGVTYNKELLYRNSINALSTVNECNPSKELIDYILNNMAFKMSIEVGDYKTAVRYWNNSFKEPVTVKHNCGCHGY